MPKRTGMFITLILAMSLSGCGEGKTIAPVSTYTHAPEAAVTATSTVTVKPTTTTKASMTATITATVAPATATPNPALINYPLSEAGSYFTGFRKFTFVDESRGDRKVPVRVWYPAIRPEGFLGAFTKDAAPDMSGAPYPLMLMSTKMANAAALDLVSHGFSVVSLDYLDSYSLWDEWLIDYPLDLRFALRQVAAKPLQGLQGVIDAEKAGVMGYSFDGYDALAMSGARVDPEYYLAQCANVPAMDPKPEDWWVKYICNLADQDKWKAFTAYAGEALTESEDGLWQPMTDPRIRAVMPMAPEGAWLFGERGLAAVDRPTLIIAAGNDDMNYYNLEAVPIFERLGTPDKLMITFLGQGHMMIFDYIWSQRMMHFAVAFFGYYLQGKQDYRQYFSQEFVEGLPELGWGVVR